MATFGTGELKNLPRTIADGMIKDAKTESTVAALSTREPMRFGNVDFITFNDIPKAEFVEEGADKSPTTASFGVVTAKPRKAQVTMRFNQEVEWADQDYQLGVLTELASAGKTALARALDLGMYHRINPLTGSEISDWTNYIGATQNRVKAEGKPATEIEAAVGALVGAQKRVTGIALDPSYAWGLATERDTQGRKLYPELGLGVEVQSFEGFRASVGDTVSGRPEATDTKARAIIGDFTNGIRWGVQRELPVEVIRFGDPDGQGDLKRKNQIALRLEIVYGWYVFADRFAVIEEAAS